MPVRPSRVVPEPRSHRWGSVLPPVMLFVTVVLAALLWFRAVPMSVGALAGLGEGDSVEVTATGCDGTGVCTVAWPAGPENGGTVERTLDAPGLFAPENGSRILVTDNDGRLERAGWAPVGDAALMTALALGLSGLALGWFRRVLNSAPIMPDDYGDLEPLEDILERQFQAEAKIRQATTPEHAGDRTGESLHKDTPDWPRRAGEQPGKPDPDLRA